MTPVVARTQIGPIPVFHAPVPGPVHAALVARVGIADERPPTAGITHVVEHLALSRVGRPRFEFQGTVETVQTVVNAAGTADEVSSFIASFCRDVANLPLERLDAELRILRDESATRTPGPFDQHAWLHFGTLGVGAGFAGELGLRRLDGVAIQDWARHWFNRSNVALIWGGPDAPDIQLDLPDGERRPVVMPPDLIERPSWQDGAPGGIAVSAVVPRTAAAAMSIRILASRLEDRLRYERGISYAVGPVYEPVSRDRALAIAFATVGPDDGALARDVFVETIAELAAAGATADELEADVDMLRRLVEDPMAPLAEAARLATQELLSATEDGSSLIDRASAVRPDDSRVAFAEAASHMVITLPPDVAPPDGYNELPDSLAGIPSGRRFQLSAAGLRKARGVELIVGSDQAGFASRDGGRRVPFAEVTVALAAADGVLTLVHRSGAELPIDPLDWRGGQEALEMVRSGIDPDLFVEAPATAKAEPAKRVRGGITTAVRWAAVGGLVEFSVGYVLALEPDRLAGSATIDVTAGRLAVIAGLAAMIAGVLLPLFVYRLRNHRPRIRELGAAVAMASIVAALLMLPMPGAIDVAYVPVLVAIYAAQALYRSRGSMTSGNGRSEQRAALDPEPVSPGGLPES